REAVDRHRASLNGGGDALSPLQIAGVERGGQAIRAVVRQRDGFFFGIEGGDRQNRPEHFFLEQAVLGFDVVEDCGFDIPAAAQRVVNLAAVNERGALLL